MIKDVVDEELERYRNLALDLAGCRVSGYRTANLVGKVRSCQEDLICLMEEAPDERREEIEYLIDRFDELQKRMLH